MATGRRARWRYTQTRPIQVFCVQPTGDADLRYEDIMGFSLSCYASHQTVSEGDKCRVIPIYQTQGYHAEKAAIKGEFMPLRPARDSWNAHSTGWAPVGEFMAAEAQEYGRVQLQRTGQVRRQLWSLIRHMLVCSPVLLGFEDRGEPFDLLAFLKRQSVDLYHAHLAPANADRVVIGEEHDNALSECWRYVWENFAHHRLFVRDVFGRMRPMEFAIIHEDAYQALVARQVARTCLYGVSHDIASAISEAMVKSGEDLVPPGAEPLDPLTTRLVRASRFTELMFGVLPTQHGLPLLRDHLHEAFLQVDKGELPKESVCQLLRPDIEGLYALAAADNLGIALAPVQFAPEEDYENHCGRTYLKFIEEVSKKVDRSRQEVVWGAFHQFELVASSQSQVTAMVEDAKGWDCGFQLVSVEPNVNGEESSLLVRIEATLTLAELHDLLNRAGFVWMSQSVVSV